MRAADMETEVLRPIEMLESPAMRVLSQAGHRVLSRIEIEYAKRGGRDNGALPLSYDEFERYGIDRHAIAPAIRELEALGFIRVKHGHAGNAEQRSPNLFRLSYMNNQWKRIKSMADAKLIQANARKAKTLTKRRHNNGAA